MGQWRGELINKLIRDRPMPVINPKSFCKIIPTQKPQPYTEYSNDKHLVCVFYFFILQFCICRIEHHSAKLSLHKNHSHIQSASMISIWFVCFTFSFCNSAFEEQHIILQNYPYKKPQPYTEDSNDKHLVCFTFSFCNSAFAEQHIILQNYPYNHSHIQRTALISIWFVCQSFLL